MSDPLYWAHSGEVPTSDHATRFGWQPLADHLEAVARIAGQLAGLARPGDERFSSLAQLSGLLRCHSEMSRSRTESFLSRRGLHSQHRLPLGAILLRIQQRENGRLAN